MDDNNGNYVKFSDVFLGKGDYLRLKNITLGYTLPKHVTRHIGLEKGSLRVYMSIDNVATITGYSGIDPEVGNYGIDSGVYPVSRFFNFVCNVHFSTSTDHEKDINEFLSVRQRIILHGLFPFSLPGLLLPPPVR